MTRKEKMEFKRQVMQELYSTWYDLANKLNFPENLNGVSFPVYIDKRLNKTATKVSDLAKQYSEATTGSSNPPSPAKGEVNE